MEQEAINAYIKLRVIAKSLQEDWTADWSNSNQKKWRVWFEYKAGVGFVVNDTNYDNTNTNTNCSSHLCEIPMAQTLATGWAIIYDNAY
jgi:hypothetical protein